MNPSARTGFYANACSQKRTLSAIEREFGPVIVGEWSLATDNCAMVSDFVCVPTASQNLLVAQRLQRQPPWFSSHAL